VTRDSSHPISGARLVRRSSSEEAQRYIQRLIFDGSLHPGERVPQSEVAEVLGISRIPVREALIALERGGSVTIEPHRGAFVRALDEPAVRDHFEVSGIIYGLAVRRAIAVATPKLDQCLLDILALLRSTTEPGRCWEVGVGFHRSVVAAAGSGAIDLALRALSGLVPDNFFELVPAAILAERTALTEISSAIVQRHADDAAAAYAEMLARRADFVVSLLCDHDVPAGCAGDLRLGPEPVVTPVRS